MAHALIWSELSTSDLTSEITPELPFAGFGTITSGSWNKRLFKLKWLNSSVENINIWIENEYADVYTNSSYPVVKKTDNIKLLQDLGFDVRVTLLDSINITNLTKANVATGFNFSFDLLGSTNRMITPTYIDGVKIDSNSVILVKNQTLPAENGLYKILAPRTSGSGLSYVYAEDWTTFGKTVSSGSTSYYAYNAFYTPFESAQIGTTSVKWVDRSTLYKLANVQCATTENLQVSGAGLTYPSTVIDSKTLSVNDRVLVKDQTSKSQNGIYYVTSLASSGKNTVINTPQSSSSSDDFWDDISKYIVSNNPVNVQVNYGSVGSGKYYRFYSGLAQTTGVGSTTDLNWTDATHYYTVGTVDYYYEISAGSAIGFSYGASNAGLFNSTPRQITTYAGVATTLNLNEKVLVKHYNNSYNGVYTVTNVDGGGSGSTAYWIRTAGYGTVVNELKPFIVRTTNSRNTIGGDYWYMMNDTKANFILNADTINISDSYLAYNYLPVGNLINTEISNFNSVNQSLFNNAGIANSQRVLVAGQTTIASQNGIYFITSSSGSTLGLDFYSTFTIDRGSIIKVTGGTVGSGKTYFLYADGASTSAGSTNVKFVDITSVSYSHCNAQTTKDKMSSVYITPDDFDVNVSTGSTVLVNTSNNLINGIYQATVGTGFKNAFNYASGLKTWMKDIYKEVLTSSSLGVYSVTPNLRSQIKGIYQASTIGATNHIFYVPEVVFPSFNGYEKYFTTDGKGGSVLQELDIDWYQQNFQDYNVKGVLNIASEASLPVSAGTAISRVVRKNSTNTLVSNFDDILVYVGTASSTGSTYNGVYRVIGVTASMGSSIYLQKHEDFNYSTEFVSGTSVKYAASPYERPTNVFVEKGYFLGGTAFTFDNILMQGEISYSVRTASFGASAITPDDDNHIHAGSEIWFKDSIVNLTRDYTNFQAFPKLAPIQHKLIGDINKFDILNGDMLIVNRGSRLYSQKSGDTTFYYYQLGDRVYYEQTNEDYWNFSSIPVVNGIYQIVHIDSSNWTYHLRKVKNRAVNGHLDFAKRLKIASWHTIEDFLSSNTVDLIRNEDAGSGTTFRWNANNYNLGSYANTIADIFIIDGSGNKTSFNVDDQVTVIPSSGQIILTSTLSATNAELYVYIYRDSTIPKYNETSKSLINRYFLVDQVLADRNILNSKSVITSVDWTREKQYFQVNNVISSANATAIKYSRDRKTWLNDFTSSKIYRNDIDYVVSLGSTTDYFFTTRLSQDGYYKKVSGKYTSTFDDTNLTLPSTGASTGIFTGKIYLQKAFMSGTALSSWSSGLSLSAGNIVLLKNNNTTSSTVTQSIGSTYQSSYYDDNSILITHDKYGKRDQKVYEFSETTAFEVTLAYSGYFPNPFTSTRALVSNSGGIGTYSLYYDPDSTNRATSSRSWIDESARNSTNVSVGSTNNISDLNAIQNINGVTSVVNNLVLLKDQTNKRQNGVYIVNSRNKYVLKRDADLNENSEIRALGRVSYNSQVYELILPNSASYSIGDTAGNTPLYWKKRNKESSYIAAVVTSSNYSGTALTTAFADSIDGYPLNQNDKVLLNGQTSTSERYLGRFTQNNLINLSRVTVGGSGNTSHFSITSCYVNDANRNLEYELYFDPSLTSLGTDPISWFRRNYIASYTSCGFASTTNVNISGPATITGAVLGDRFLAKNQTNDKENIIYAIDNPQTWFMVRHQDLDLTSEISLTNRVQVTSGYNNSGIYGLVYDETVTPSIDTSGIYFSPVNTSYILDDCKCATTANISSFSSASSTIDGITLETGDRILVKNQTDKTKNGIYYLKDSTSNTWERTDDLNSSAELLPQLAVYVTSGTTNGSTNYRIKLPTPRTITYSQTTAYILDTDNIDWILLSDTGLFNSNPDTWLPLGIGSSNSYNIGKAYLSTNSIASSKRFGIAIKAPDSTKLASYNITSNGNVRNLRFKVEYKTIDD
jgi:hypothetical protein